MPIIQATNAYVGDLCWICKAPIQLGERIIFLGGPDMAHADCFDEVSFRG